MAIFGAFGLLVCSIEEFSFFTLFGAAAIFGLLIHWRIRTIELRVTDREFNTNHHRSLFGFCTSLSVSTVQSLEFREEGLYRLRGLYARLKDGEKCLLPDLDEQETQLAIKSIRDRYPEMLLPNAPSLALRP